MTTSSYVVSQKRRTEAQMKAMSRKEEVRKTADGRLQKNTSRTEPIGEMKSEVEVP